MDVENRVILFMNHKGGVGKTTQAYNAARNFLRNGRKVVCLDFDQQKNIAKMLPEITVDNVAVSDIKSIPADYVIIDTAPRFEPHHVKLMKAADVIIIPFNLERLDIEQTTDMLELVQDLNVQHKTRLIMVHSGKNTKMYKALSPFVEGLIEDFGVEILSEMRRSQAVAQANLENKTVFEINSPPDVRKEFKELFSNLGKFIKEVAPLKRMERNNPESEVSQCQVH